MTSIPKDPFTIGRDWAKTAEYLRDFYEYQTYISYTGGEGKQTYEAGFIWHLRCVGPDRTTGSPYFYGIIPNKELGNIYDPTNGTRSKGEIYLTNKGFFDGTMLN